MNTIVERIQQADVCEYIDLVGQEKDLYRGVGWRLARFENGILAEIYDIENVPMQENIEAMTAAAIANARAWLSERDATQVYFVLCSCYQLCEPVAMTNEWAWKKMEQVLFNEFSLIDSVE
ncbi:MAG: hypothetical protein FWH15_09565 [Betaproteobacteria bacterium]|nr:hypothetical protein [Betaproteobacteria bacterium]